MDTNSATVPTGERPLAGWRVLNTRSVEDAAGFSAALAALGAEPIELPATRITPPDDNAPLDAAIRALAAAGQSLNAAFDWIAFTSPHAVDAFLARLLALGFDNRTLARSRVAAVGPGTAARLTAHGLSPDLVPDRAAGRHLAAALGDVAGLRILLPRSDVALRDLPESLSSRGAAVTEVVAYVARPVDVAPDRVAAVFSEGVDAAVFFSPSGVAGIAALVAPRTLPDALGRATVVCIGRTTAAAAERAGLQVLVAEESTVERIVAELIRARRER